MARAMNRPRKATRRGADFEVFAIGFSFSGYQIDPGFRAVDGDGDPVGKTGDGLARLVNHAPLDAKMVGALGLGQPCLAGFNMQGIGAAVDVYSQGLGKGVAGGLLAVHPDNDVGAGLLGKLHDKQGGQGKEENAADEHKVPLLHTGRIGWADVPQICGTGIVWMLRIFALLLLKCIH